MDKWRRAGEIPFLKIGERRMRAAAAKTRSKAFKPVKAKAQKQNDSNRKGQKNQSKEEKKDYVIRNEQGSGLK